MSDWKFSDFISKDVLFKTPEKGLIISELYDKVTGGAIKGQTHLFIAGSGAGKTRTGVGVACDLLRQGWKVVYLTFEQSPVQIAELVLANFNNSKTDAINAYDMVKDLPLAIKSFETTNKETIVNTIGSYSNADALIIDYLCLPDDCRNDGTETSGILRSMMKDIKTNGEKNNQFIFCLMQGKEKDDISFASRDNIWGSRQVINPVEVAVIANRRDKNLIDLDFIKVRYSRISGFKIRLKRTMFYETSKYEDLGLFDENDKELDVCEI